MTVDVVRGHREGTKDFRACSISTNHFGTLPDGRDVFQYVLSNGLGLSVSLINFGSTITAINTPDREENFSNIVLGYQDLESYVNDIFYCGVVVGRYANRISNAEFLLDETPVTLSKNSGKNHLHGGFTGFGKKLWNSEVLFEDHRPKIKMNYLSKAGEEGYPGNLRASVVYSFCAGDTLEIIFEAETDSTTIVNLTQHPYFNLSGKRNLIHHHSIQLNGEYYLPVKSDMIPEGRMDPVMQTCFDLRQPTMLEERLQTDSEQIVLTRGFDHCWVLENPKGKLKSAAFLKDAETGRTLEVLTDAPGIQLYTGNFLGTNGHEGTVNKFKKHGALCLEPQSFPDSPNLPGFPSVVLKPGERYRRTIKYRFGF